MTDDAALIDSLVTRISAINPLQAQFLSDSLAGVEAAERDDLAVYIAYGLAEGLSIDYLAGCYDLIVKDTLREQMYFQRHKRYRHASFEEVAQSVYFDDEYMRKYMHGLAITGYLWPNHRELHRFFAANIPTDRGGRYLEIGPGHGMYMMTAMRHSGYSEFHGIDLSPTSVAMTRDLLGSGRFGDFRNCHIFEQDFLAGDIEAASCAAVVMGEVLEHVEQPGLFLERIRDVAADDAFIFITTPINAPAIDHIYLFDSFDSIESLVDAAGLSIRQQLLVPYPGLSVDESMQRLLPINVALVLGK
ncbi:MAG: methyltransferase domain-containing protein [Gammaproteobacteria bacterium]|nr:methyltransferase domain-containing protein [Gammaproteobacteria bacterium]